MESEDSMDDGGGEWHKVKGRMTQVKRRRQQSMESSSASSEESAVKVGGGSRMRGGCRVIVKFVGGHDIGKVGPVKLSREIHRCVGEVEMVRVMADGALLIVCKDEGQRVKAVGLREVCGRKVEVVKRVGVEPVVKGVVYGIPVGEDLEELKGEVRGAQVVGIRRLQARREGVRVDSLSVVMEFRGRVVPKRVVIGCSQYRVRPFVPPPLRCYKCQRYGHIAAGCKGKLRCGKCGGEHGNGQCPEGAEEKCVNCGGKHPVFFGGV